MVLTCIHAFLKFLKDVRCKDCYNRARCSLVSRTPPCPATALQESDLPLHTEENKKRKSLDYGSALA